MSNEDVVVFADSTSTGGQSSRTVWFTHDPYDFLNQSVCLITIVERIVRSYNCPPSNLLRHEWYWRQGDIVISIIIPAYNEQDYIRECVKSVLRQSCEQGFEVLVCDDKSSDRTGEILTSLSKEEERLQILHNSTNEGIIRTVKRLTEKANGEFLLRIDADSVLFPGTLQAMYEKFDSGVDLVFGRVNVRNTGSLHPTAVAIGKQRGRGTWYGGACIGVNHSKFVQTGGFKENMKGAEVQELKQRAEIHDWTISRLDEYGVESNFPTELWPVLRRKFDSGRTHVTQYVDAPQSFSIWELRGPIFWTVFLGVSLSSLFVTPLGVLAALMFLLAVYHYSKDAKLAVSISGRPSFLVLYPVYQIISGVLRTAGVWTRIDSVLAILGEKIQV